MKIAILYIVIAWPGNGHYKTKAEIPSMDECLKILSVTEIVIPEGNNENEWGGVKTCYYK